MNGNIWMFSDQIDDLDIEFAKKVFITYRMGREYYGLGEKPMIRLAWESGAVYKIGKKVLIRRDIFEEYLRNNRKVMEEKRSTEALRGKLHK